MKSAMKPCPFCGSLEATVENMGGAMWWICCANCDADGPTDSSVDGATARWDARPREDHLPLLLNDALFALENVGVEPDLCERIRQVLRTDDDNPVQKVEPGLFDEMGF